MHYTLMRVADAGRYATVLDDGARAFAKRRE